MRLDATNIIPALTGQALEEAIKATKNKRLPIADGFIYEQTITMMAADPGCGKSTIATQMAIELAAGLPVFGVFEVPRPMNVLYAQTERSIMEFLERIDIISKVYPICKDNLFVTDEYQKLNMLDPEHALLLIECVKRDCPKVDVIFFDPIYSMVSGGLSQDVPASAFTHAMSAVQKATNCTLYYNHHTIKPQHNNRGEEIQRADPFYGSNWLKAHVTGSFHMQATKEGVTLIKKKDNYNLMPHTIALHYNAETGLSMIPNTELPAIEKIKNFIRAKGLMKKEFCFNDICEETGLCNRTVRSALLHSSISAMLEVVSSIRNKNLYKMRGS